MSRLSTQSISRVSRVVLALLLIAATTRVATAIVIEIPADEFDAYVVPSDPAGVHQTDLVSIWQSSQGVRYGVLQFDLSSVTEPITSVYLSMSNNSNNSTYFNNSLVAQPATFVRSSAWSQDLTFFTYNDYASSIRPVEQQFQTFGSGTFAPLQPVVGEYGTFAAASSADVAMFENVRQGDGKITMVLKAVSGNRDLSDIGLDQQPPRLYINEPPPTPSNADLRLNVNPFTGASAISNPLQVGSLDLDGYTIRSAGNSLNPDPTHTAGVGWDSLTNAGQAGWSEYSPAASGISELNISSSLTIASPGTVNLGKPFVPLAARDVAFTYSVAGGTVQPGIVNYVGGLQLNVTKLVGNGGTDLGTVVLLSNPEPVGIALDGYVVRSAGGRLIPAGLNGLKDQLGGGWAEIALSTTSLTELNLSGMTTIPANSVRSLGSAFTPGGATDLVFRYNVAGAGAAYQQLSGSVAYVTALRGDANSDKIVNIFDINMISSQWNTTGPNGDVNFDGIVNIFDINLVSSNWNSSIPGATTAVPEPGGLTLLLLGSIGVGWSISRLRPLMHPDRNVDFGPELSR